MPRLLMAGRLASRSAVGDGVEDDGGGDQRDAAEEQKRIAFGRDDVAADRADDQRQADADGEGYGEARDVDGGDKEQVGDIEDDATDDGEQDVRCAGLAYVGEEGSAGAAHAAEREAPGDGGNDEAEHVVPIEELKAVAGHELERVCP